MKIFTIAELEILTGLKSHTIRIWEKRYLLLKPRRNSANIRFYTLPEAEELLTISLLNRHGFKISRLSTLDIHQRKQKLAELRSAEATYDKALKDLLLSIFAADAEKFEFILDSCIASLGTHITVTSIIFPLLKRLRNFWYKPGINPIQDHFISIIRQKLYLAVERVSVTEENKGCCLLLPLPGHAHDLELLCNYYSCKRAGFKAIHLASNATVDHLDWVVAQKQPEFIIVHVSAKRRNTAQDILKLLSIRFPQTQLLAYAEQSVVTDATNLKFVSCPHEVAGMVSELYKN